MQRKPNSTNRPPPVSGKPLTRDRHLAWFHTICDATPEQLAALALERGISIEGKTSEQLGSLLLAAGA